MTSRYIFSSLLIASIALTGCGNSAPEPVAQAAVPAPAAAPALPSEPAPIVEHVEPEVPVEPSIDLNEGDDVPAPPRTTRVRIVDSAIATNVQQRVPTGLGEVFSTDAGTIWAWVAVENRGEPTKVTMVWRRDDKVRSTLDLPVGTSPRWRTWSRTRLRKFDAGEWTVDIYDEDGNVLDTLEFTVRDTGDVG